MAVKPWAELSASYRQRLARAGIGPLDKPSSRQRARGHASGEHKARATLSGNYTFSATDRSFLARQRKRAPEKQYSKAMFEKSKAIYRSMSPTEREEIRHRQNAMGNHFRRAKLRNKKEGGFAYAHGRPADYRNEKFYETLKEYGFDAPVFDNEFAILMFYH